MHECATDKNGAWSHYLALLNVFRLDCFPAPSIVRARNIDDPIAQETLVLASKHRQFFSAWSHATQIKLLRIQTNVQWCLSVLPRIVSRLHSYCLRRPHCWQAHTYTVPCTNQSLWSRGDEEYTDFSVYCNSIYWIRIGFSSLDCSMFSRKFSRL